MSKKSRSPLFVIFVTVFLDLIGFGMVIPLVGLYGKHYGATALELALLGAVFSFMQFIFAPFWGNLSDVYGRRPILLISLLGSTLSYFFFGISHSFALLFVSRAFAGIFAANISAAQAYIADVTTPAERARGMGLLGAAFGIGFTLGPPLGGIATHSWGLSAPGFIAAAICGANLILAYFRLPESLSPEIRAKARRRSYSPVNLEGLRTALAHPVLWVYILIFFFITFGFSQVEQTFALFFQWKYNFSIEDAGLKTGLVLMWMGFLNASIQGGAIRKLVAHYHERPLLVTGLGLYCVGLTILPFIPEYALYYLLMIPMIAGSALVNPTLSSLISQTAPAHEQGAVLGLAQGLGSLARAVGPFCGLLVFAKHPTLPFLIAAAIAGILFLFSLGVKGRSQTAGRNS